MLVKTAMLPNPLTVPPETSLVEFIDRVLHTNQTTAVVVSAEGVMLGVVSVHDIFRRILPHYVNMAKILADIIHEGYLEEKFERFRRTRVDEIMVTTVDCVAPGDAMMKATGLFVLKQRKTIPVVDGGRFIGIVTRRSVLRELIRPPLANAEG